MTCQHGYLLVNSFISFVPSINLGALKARTTENPGLLTAFARVTYPYWVEPFKQSAISLRTVESIVVTPVKSFIREKRISRRLASVCLAPGRALFSTPKQACYETTHLGETTKAACNAALRLQNWEHSISGQ